ncbi:hypothetical protein GCM10009630_12710 [Kribbella jejuensis]|uniref:Pyruvate,water dikinase n=1 Tax=Kribbella jejuensis TaxID=236068 RepID=A0A542E9I8_9ACTN|nr:PEP/pyruvate-binding domain-containing protein [Kribbella jejuensis]TQJ11990.1 pyruvate,water dikinase [Kribbella jejuensis]
MLIPLVAATSATCGHKASALAALLQAGLPVPDGVVIPFSAASGARPGGVEVDELRRWLVEMGDPVVAVRSSASDEDGGGVSAAGRYDSFLGVQGLDAVVDAVRACRASLWSARATAYRKAPGEPSMAVIVQLQVDADVSGVMFTPTSPSAPTLIESSWGLGPTVVEGRQTPDRYQVLGDTVTSTIADKPTSLTVTGPTPVPTAKRRTPTLTTATAHHLAALAHQTATLFGTPQDIEWAIADTKTWLLQSRPITAHPPTPTKPPNVHAVTSSTPTAPPTCPAPPQPPTVPAAATLTKPPQTPTGPWAAGTLTEPPQAPTGSRAAVLTGISASQGTATGPARIVRGPADFLDVHPGDILVCPHTDPAWTPLLAIAAGVITESGGVLSHAAIVAREQSIPAVVAVPQATTRIPAGAHITLNGTTGAVHVKRAEQT